MWELMVFGMLQHPCSMYYELDIIISMYVYP